MSRRLDTNVRLNDEASRLYAAGRKYERIRQNCITELASKARIGLSVMEAQGIYDRANGISQGIFETFQLAVQREVEDIVKKSPERVRYSAFADWINDEMSDQEKARREIVQWLDNPKYAAFDTETTGFFDEGHVPVTAASTTLEGISLCDITMRALDEKGNTIKITEGASKANHLTDDLIAEYLPLEQNEMALISLEALMEDGRIFVGYNTKFDRDMMGRAIRYASAHLGTTGGVEPTPDVKRLVERLAKLYNYFSDPAHWLETKDVFCRAIGLEPYPGQGKYAKLEDIARATNALATGENQEHGALADCQLIARIVQNIRKELETTMPKPKTTAKGPFPAMANPADNEPAEETEVSGSDWPESAKNYTAQLETSLSELQAQYEAQGSELEALRDYRVKLGDRIRELENLCEQYQQSDGIKHHEARELTWCDLEINGFRFNWTIREGEPVEAAVESAFKTVRALQAIRDTDKVKTFRVGLRDNWQPLKGFDKPANGKPTDEQPPTASEKPATPKGNQPPAANKPGTPPPANKPNVPPPQQQPATPPAGKTTGEKKSQQCDRIVRHQIDGQNTFDLPFTLTNGKPADRPFAPSKKDTGTLEKALAAAGYDVTSFDIGTEYDLPILVEWTVGQQIPKSDPPKFYRDNMTFTITVNEPF